MSNPNVTFAPGQRIGSYEMLLELAAGGTATVGIAIYRGAAGFERLVVIKRVHRHLTKDGEFTAMLLDEARLASSVRHPNVVSVIDVVRAEDEVILVMEYVESVSLSQLTKEAARVGAHLPLPVVSRILCDVLWGLHEAHEAVDIRRQPLGIVHRDVSPQNVIIGVDGVSRVIDFGIAKARSRIAHTRAGIIKGKCAYMAPEQVDGQQVDRRADVFSAGVVLWEALTGKRLFRGDDEFDEMRRVMRAPIPPPSSVNPQCGADVDALLSHALSRPLDERFQTARAFVRALEQTIPPAPPRVVAEHVEAICGTELQYRHGRLQAILGDELEKLSPRSASGPAAKVVTQDAVAPAVSLRDPTLRLAAPARTTPSQPKPALPSATLRSSDPSSSPVAEMPTESGLELPRRRSLTPTLLVVTAVSVLVGAGVATAWLSQAREPVAAGTPSATGTAAATATATGATTTTTTTATGATATATATVTATTTAPPHLTPRPPASGSPSAPPRELKNNPYGP